MTTVVRKGYGHLAVMPSEQELANFSSPLREIYHGMNFDHAWKLLIARIPHHAVICQIFKERCTDERTFKAFKNRNFTDIILAYEGSIQEKLNEIHTFTFDKKGVKTPIQLNIVMFNGMTLHIDENAYGRTGARIRHAPERREFHEQLLQVGGLENNCREIVETNVDEEPDTIHPMSWDEWQKQKSDLES